MYLFSLLLRFYLFTTYTLALGLHSQLLQMKSLQVIWIRVFYFFFFSLISPTLMLLYIDAPQTVLSVQIELWNRQKTKKNDFSESINFCSQNVICRIELVNFTKSVGKMGDSTQLSAFFGISSSVNLFFALRLKKIPSHLTYTENRLVIVEG